MYMNLKPNKIRISKNIFQHNDHDIIEVHRPTPKFTPTPQI